MRKRIPGICSRIDDPIQHLRLLQRGAQLLSHPSLSLHPSPLPVLDRPSHLLPRNLRCSGTGLLVLGLLDRRASKSGQGFHELDLPKIECSRLCSLSGGRYVSRGWDFNGRSSRYLTENVSFRNQCSIYDWNSVAKNVT